MKKKNSTLNNRIFKIIVPVLFVLFSFFIIKKIVAYAASYSISEGYYLIETKLKSGSYINVASSNNGADAILGTEKQVFYLNKVENGYYRIEYCSTNGKTGEYLDEEGNHDQARDKIIIWGTTDADGQRWELVRESENSEYYCIYRKNSTIKGAIDIAGASTDSGTKIQLFSQNNNDNQKWRFVTPSFTNTLIYNANGGTVTPSSQTQTVIYPDTRSSFTISNIIPTRPGYKFDGWYTSAVGGTRISTSTSVGNNYMSSDQSKTVYAHWSHVHDLSYESDGAKLVATCSNLYGDCTIEGSQKKVELILEPDSPNYSGEEINPAWKIGHDINFVISGSEAWNTAFGVNSLPAIYYEGTQTTSYEKTIEKPIDVGTYKASIEAGGKKASVEFEIKNLCTVSFDSNGGIGRMPSVDVSLGLYTIPTCRIKPSRGKEFDGWVKDGEKIEGSTITLTGDTTIYARWIDHDHRYTTITIKEGMTKTSCRCGKYIIGYE